METHVRLSGFRTCPAWADRQRQIAYEIKNFVTHAFIDIAKAVRVEHFIVRRKLPRWQEIRLGLGPFLETFERL